MSSKAIVKDDWQYDGIKVAILREHHGRRELLTWSLGEVRVLDEQGAERPEDDKFITHLTTAATQDRP
jgi:hypothetical protein